MDFSLTDDHEQLLTMVREFAQREVKPLAAALDRDHRFPAELVRRMAELGLMGIEVPPELDGSGLDTVAYVLAMEEISAACASTIARPRCGRKPARWRRAATCRCAARWRWTAR